MSPNPEETADLVTFTEEILNRKPHFLCSIIKEHSDLNKARTLFYKSSLSPQSQGFNPDIGQ